MTKGMHLGVQERLGTSRAVILRGKYQSVF
jgi:hypothetical protein